MSVTEKEAGEITNTLRWGQVDGPVLTEIIQSAQWGGGWILEADPPGGHNH